jgi:hypothetical protein
MIGDFGFLRLELQDVFEVKVVDAVIRDKYFGGKLAVFTSYSSYWS